MNVSTDLQITNNTFLRQYECAYGDDLARVEYAHQEKKIFLTKLIIPEAAEEDDAFRNEFLKGVLDHIKEDGTMKMVPTNPKIAGFVRRNRMLYKELLPVGINI